jgi:hypothetical protein
VAVNLDYSFCSCCRDDPIVPSSQLAMHVQTYANGSGSIGISPSSNSRQSPPQGGSCLLQEKLNGGGNTEKEASQPVVDWQFLHVTVSKSVEPGHPRVQLPEQ